jgi:hypothetical protein
VTALPARRPHGPQRLLGPKCLNVRDRVAVLAGVFNRPITIREVSAEQHRADPARLLPMPIAAQKVAMLGAAVDPRLPGPTAPRRTNAVFGVGDVDPLDDEITSRPLANREYRQLCLQWKPSGWRRVEHLHFRSVPTVSDVGDRAVIAGGAAFSAPIRNARAQRCIPPDYPLSGSVKPLAAYSLVTEGHR